MAIMIIMTSVLWKILLENKKTKHRLENTLKFISDKGLIFKICKEPEQSVIKQANIEWANYLNKYYTKEDIQVTSMWKDTQHF